MTGFDDRTTSALERIASALERIAPAPGDVPDWSIANAWMWGTEPDRLTPIPKVNRVEMELLIGIDRARNTLMENTQHFARGLSANNVLLWGARGRGKSSLVKAAHAQASVAIGRLQADIQTLIRARVGLSKFAIRVQLYRKQERHVHDLRQFAKILADTFFLSV